jgi:Ca2+-binding EF-hand superfamily protein
VSGCQAAFVRLGLPCSEEYVAEMMAQYDENRDSLIDWPEFKKYVGKREKDIRKAFKQLDKDASGEVTQKVRRQATLEMR